jgi:hypothetical protein
MLFISGTLLFYTAMVMPVQIFMWDYGDPCNKFPTLYFDVIVDSFFLVSLLRHCIDFQQSMSMHAPDNKDINLYRLKRLSRSLWGL